MPSFCAVLGCSNRSNREKHLRFFRLPPIRTKYEGSHRRQQWLDAINRDDITETKLRNFTICSEHFLSGKPADYGDMDHPDYTPSVKMGQEIEKRCKGPQKINVTTGGQKVIVEMVENIPTTTQSVIKNEGNLIETVIGLDHFWADDLTPVAETVELTQLKTKKKKKRHNEETDVSVSDSNIQCLYCERTAAEVSFFHPFPDDPAKAQLWLEALGIVYDGVMPITWRLCNFHFAADQYECVENAVLREDAVPSYHEKLREEETTEYLEESGENPQEIWIENEEIHVGQVSEENVVVEVPIENPDNENPLERVFKAEIPMQFEQHESSQDVDESFEETENPLEIDNSQELTEDEVKTEYTEIPMEIQENEIVVEEEDNIPDIPIEIVYQRSPEKIKRRKIILQSNEKNELKTDNITTFPNRKEIDFSQIPKLVPIDTSTPKPTMKRSHESVIPTTSSKKVPIIRKVKIVKITKNQPPKSPEVQTPQVRSVKMLGEGGLTDLCRICAKPIEKSALDSTILKEKLKFVIPELDHEMYPSPAICENCCTILTQSYSLKKVSLSTEAMLKESMSANTSAPGPLDLILYMPMSLKANLGVSTNSDQAPGVSEDNKPELDHSYALDEGTPVKIFNCDICGGLFDNSMKFQTHVRSHQRYNYLCAECGLYLYQVTIETKKEHIEYHKSKRNEPSLCQEAPSEPQPTQPRMMEKTIKLSRCEICGLRISMNMIEKHIQQHYPQVDCNNCNALFHTEELLNDHLGTCVKKNTCLVCYSSFTSKLELRMHKRNDHKIGPSTKKVHKIGPRTKKVHRCEKCNITFSSRKILESHYLTKRHALSLPINYTLKNRGSNRQCHLCYKIFPFPNSLKIHLKYVHEESRFKCEVCQKVFRYEVSLHRHMEKMHSIRGNFQCNECTSAFWSEKTLKGHFIKKHPDSIVI